jgi:hypothetical protein
MEHEALILGLEPGINPSDAHVREARSDQPGFRKVQHVLLLAHHRCAPSNEKVCLFSLSSNDLFSAGYTYSMRSGHVVVARKIRISLKPKDNLNCGLNTID